MVFILLVRLEKEPELISLVVSHGLLCLAHQQHLELLVLLLSPGMLLSVLLLATFAAGG